MTKIEWATDTWNPIVGCSKVSPGCANCYAERMAFRQTQMRPGCEYCDVMIGKKWNGKTAFVESQLDKPLHWRKPRRIFVCSMGDLFHESVHDAWVGKVWDVMTQCPQHTFLLLTKRPEGMRRLFCEPCDIKMPPNIHIGVTAENQEQADKRIPILLQIPAAVRFVSIEPMLGPVSLWEWFPDGSCEKPAHITGVCEKNEEYENGIHHVICGGESGPGARPLHPDWVRSLRDQCVSADVPFMFKQGPEVERGPLVKLPFLDGRQWVQYPKGGDQ